MCLSFGAPAAFAQDIQTDPMQCWWRTSVPAVRVGETFAVVLTCAVLETDDATVVVDQSKLEPSVVQFPPFETLPGGQHGADLHTDLRRFFQYEYRLRLIAENDFGKDVPLPEMKLSYRVQSRVGQNAAIQGRDQSYVLPPHSVRVLSLVPADATDIRDSSAETFVALDQRGFRANLLVVIGGVLFALAGLLALLALVRLFGRYRQPGAAKDTLVTDSAILGAVGRELAQVRRDREASGWSPELAGRALRAIRVAATYAVGRRPAQSEQSQAARLKSQGSPQAAGEGTIIVKTGWPKSKSIVVSGSATPRSLQSAAGWGLSNAKQTATLSSLQDAMTDLTVAQFSRGGALDASALDQAVASGAAAAKQLKFEQIWFMKKFGTKRPAPPVDARVWSR